MQRSNEFKQPSLRVIWAAFAVPSYYREQGLEIPEHLVLDHEQRN